MKRLKKKQRKELIRITEYMISGGAYFWTGYLVFALCDQILGLNLWWAKLIANITGWTINFGLQRYWVFNNRALKAHQTQVTGRYAFITLTNFILDYLIVAILREFGLSPYIGQFASSAFFTVWNYCWYRFWVFPHKFTPRKKAVIRMRHTIAHQAHGHFAYQKVRK